MAPILTALYRYPVKSTRSQPLTSSALTPTGLPFDRSWMVAAADGRMITGRSHPALVLVAAQPDERGLLLNAPGMAELFVANSEFAVAHRASVWKDDFFAWHGAVAADEWFSRYLGEPVKLLWTGAAPSRRLQESIPLGFADGYPLLLIGEASLAELNRRVGRELAMQRFRPNLVISGAPAFAEDGWQSIRIGSAVLCLSKPCERCVFTTVDPETAQKSPDQEPLRALARFRQGPAGVLFGQNAIVEEGNCLVLGMTVEVLSTTADG